MKICIVLGTRPEIIKLAPLIKYCMKHDLDYTIAHTNQHYSESLDHIFFEELGLEKAKYNLQVGSGAIAFLEDSTHGKQTAMMLERIERVFLKEKPDLVIIHGDTNTTLAGALAAAKLRIPLAHIESGLRSYDRDMPEETNRIICDHISDFLFAPTEKEAVILRGEGIGKDRISVVGNTVVDALKQNLSRAGQRHETLDKFRVKEKGYFLVTAHRPKNVDDKKNLANIISTLGELHKKYKLPVIYPMHPRTRRMFDKFNLKAPLGVVITEPLGYLEFLQLMSHAKLILTDSGGIQEEACVLKVPCVTLRDNTERPETLEVGSNMLAGTDPGRIMKAVESMLAKKPDWSNPFGDGQSAERIMKILMGKLSN
ncbi:MAG: UDP-N-acetylglucosamine 2-epimerase (non-hydrolyzing) [Candidatus Altiarchaeota archaeon]|nr:UDP-N-acetylglucosamine 2-epimerase (non-hydrolyzing) [Candidatus Altiarchaeota archaeon]